jgi:alpha-L-glutamate ligase-like protein
MAVKLNHILGLNARSLEYLKYNPKAAKRIADSKLLTKTALRKVKLSTPRLYAVVRTQQDLKKLDFAKLTAQDFVVKPNRGLGGEGIIVIEKAGKTAGEWITTQGDLITAEDIKLHVSDILEGRFSMRNLPDIAYIEERVRVHPAFEPYTYKGTPDIGVIVFNRVPVMAFLRLPTEQSGGRANMHQGAVACGIDMATGMTTHAVRYYDYIDTLPETEVSLRGIQIPDWDRVLQLAVSAAEAAGLGYMRADIVLQPSIKKPGTTIPKILELNAQPGLKIQVANKAGLRRRLERVEGLEVDTVEKGIKIAKELFADRDMADYMNKPKTISVFETVKIHLADEEKVEVKAKVDTGAYRTSIDEALAEKLGLLQPDNILFEKTYVSALGRMTRPVVGITFVLGGKEITTTANVTDRSKLKRPMLIGRKDLKGFVLGFE